MQQLAPGYRHINAFHFQQKENEAQRRTKVTE